MEDVSRFVWLEEAASCSSDVAARAVLKWCALFGVPRAFVSDDGTQFTGETMKMLPSRLRSAHHFGVANSSWTSGTIKRMNREVVRTFLAIRSERCRPVSEWLSVVGTVQWALSSAFRERLETMPFQITGRPPPTAMLVRHHLKRRSPKPLLKREGPLHRPHR